MRTGANLNSLRKYFSSSWFLAIIALIVVTVGSIGIVYAAQPQDNGEGTVYRIAVDNRGNLRLLQSDINGNFSEEPKENEFAIELPSSQLVSGLFGALQTMLGELEGTVAEQDERITGLQGTIAKQDERITGLQGIIAELDERITGLQGIIAGLDERIGALEALFDNFAINATAGAGGSILPFGAVMVDYGEDQTFTITPDEGYYILDVVVDGSSIGALNTYTFFAVAADHTIEASFAADDPVPEDTVLLLPMDEGEGPTVYDKSGMRNDGTISGASREQLPGGQWYLSFDGNDDIVSVGSDSSLNISDELTIKLWVYPDSITQNAIVITNGVPGDGFGAIALAIYGSADQICLGAPGNRQGLSGISTYLSAETWKHWVLVWNRTDGVLKFYLDGVEQTLTDVGVYWSASSSTFDIGGRRRPNVMTNFAGDIALVEVQNGLWSAPDVQNSFNQEKNLFGLQ